MGKSKVRLKPKREYSESFRKARVKEYESGEFTVAEICKLYGMSDASVYKWIYRYSIYNKKGYKIVEEKDSKSVNIKALLEKNANLERIVGQKQIMIDYLEAMIELAKEEYDIDFKKNSNTPPLER